MPFALPTETGDVSRDDLRRLTHHLSSEVERLIRRAHDADVTFQPVDPVADDPGAGLPEEAHVGWTLGHLVAHTTATAEELASLAAELARGVSYHGRSRFEVPWQSFTSRADCLSRLRESRRICTASLDLWPIAPHLDNSAALFPSLPPMGPVDCFLLGLRHEAGHLDQVRDILAQARAFRRRNSLLGRWRSGRERKNPPATPVLVGGDAKGESQPS
jgi:DinB superfamily